MTVESTFLHVIIALGILLFAAKLMAELFHRVKIPIVLGELLAFIKLYRDAPTLLAARRKNLLALRE